MTHRFVAFFSSYDTIPYLTNATKRRARSYGTLTEQGVFRFKSCLSANLGLGIWLRNQYKSLDAMTSEQTFRESSRLGVKHSRASFSASCPSLSPSMQTVKSSWALFLLFRSFMPSDELGYGQTVYDGRRLSASMMQPCLCNFVVIFQ